MNITTRAYSIRTLHQCATEAASHGDDMTAAFIATGNDPERDTIAFHAFKRSYSEQIARMENEETA